MSAAIYLPLTAGCAGWVVWREGGRAVLDQLLGAAPVGWLGLGLAGGALVALASQRLARWLPGVGAMADALAVQIGPLAPPTTLAMAALSAVGEEWLFRGVLQPGLGWLPATVLFALAHVPVDRALWPWPFLAFGIGAALAWIADLSGGLVGPIAVHFAINALNLRWLTRRAVEIRRARG